MPDNGLKTPYKDIIPPLSVDERKALKSDIEINGVIQKIVVTTKQEILDGHHRYEIANELKIPYDIFLLRESKDWDDDQKRWKVEEYALASRNLSPEQKVAIQKRRNNLIVKLKKANWTQKAIAEKFGITRQAVQKILVKQPGCQTNNSKRGPKTSARKTSLSQEEKKEIAKRVSSGDSQSQVAADFGITQGRVSTIVKQDKAKRKSEAEQRRIARNESSPVKSKYDVIVIDPPWPIEKIQRETRPNQGNLDYPTMTIKQIESIEIPSKATCHLWLWTTQKFLPNAFDLIDSWDLRYVCTFVWHKPGGPQPFGLPQYNCEFALYARKGSPKFSSTKSFKTCFEGKRGRHSEKPKEFYSMISKATTGSRLDMFGRRQIEGFDSWGNEA